MKYFQYFFKKYYIQQDDHKIGEYTLWAISLFTNEKYFLGYYYDGRVFESPFLREVPYDVNVGARKLFREINKKPPDITLQSVRSCYLEDMQNAEHIKRNSEILKKKDKLGWSFRDIRDWCGLSLSRVHDIYKEEKSKQKKLSTGKFAKSVRSPV